MYGDAQRKLLGGSSVDRVKVAIHEPAERHLLEAEGYLAVEFGHESSSEIAEIYRALAVRCIHEEVKRVLVKPGDDDYAGERALRDAFTMILLAGIAPGFRIALVAADQRVEARYRICVRDLRLANVDAKLFTSENEARLWLIPQSGSARRAA